MKSTHSNSLILVWRIAEFEARRLNASMIEPMHLLIALCKVVDLDLLELVPKTVPERDDALEELFREVKKLRTIFRVTNLDAKIFRRRLREASPERRFGLRESGRMHRSSASRQVFAEAERFARIGSGTVYPAHLLYATLLAKDKDRDQTLAKLEIEKKKLLTVARQELWPPHPGSSSSRKAGTQWN